MCGKTSFCPGRPGWILRIVRTYSSKIWGRADLLEEEPLLAEKEHSVLGYGWHFHMGRLKAPNAISNPQSSCGGDFPVYEAPDGTSRVFYPISGSDTYLSKDYWKLDRNCAYVAGGGACIWTDSGIRYEFSNSYDNQYFTGTVPVLPVSGIVDPFENRISVFYVSQTGAVSSITDTYSRTVDFTYTEGVDGLRLDTIVANGKTFAFAYMMQPEWVPQAGQQPLPGPRRFLTEVIPPAGPSELYTYGFDRTVDQNQYALSRVNLPGGASVAYDYQAVSFFTGRESVPFSVVASRTVSGSGIVTGTWTYAYSSPGYGTYSATDPRDR